MSAITIITIGAIVIGIITAGMIIATAIGTITTASAAGIKTAAVKGRASPPGLFSCLVLLSCRMARGALCSP
jgi:hypothetical protein